MSTANTATVDSPNSSIPAATIVRWGFGLIVGAALVWYLFFLDTAADNNVGHGLKQLYDGFVHLPDLLSDTNSFKSWWAWMSDDTSTLEAIAAERGGGVKSGEGWGEIIGHTIDHLQLVGISMAVVIPLSVLLGILIHRVPALSGPVVGVASVFLTIPSLALFAIFIPIVGIGDRGPILALIMYSILPILRNTVTGMEGVDRAVIESAKGIGLNSRQRLFQIELPLAWPVILTGIRVATLLNIGIAAIAPLVGGTGLGRYINDGLQRFPGPSSVERMWTGVVFTILVALVVDFAINLLARFTTSKGLQS